MDKDSKEDPNLTASSQSDMDTSQTDVEVNNTEKTDSDYFTSYNDTTVHELMLKDRPRTLAYKKFFEENRAYIVDKVVMDVGCGSGILSMFAAAAGAKKVYAIEASNIAEVCENIVECNGFKNKIEVIQKRVEDVELPNNIKVDVIVSEWMGFYLLHESMLDSVIFARDKFLKSDGIMVPSHANLLIAPVQMDKYYDDHFEYWNNVYGFDLSPMMPHAMASAMKEPLITEISEKQILAESDFIVAFELKTVTLDEIAHVEKTFEFELNNSGVVQGFATWFNVVFTCPSTEENSSTDNSQNGASNETEISMPLTLSTSPSAEQTHWKQTVIFIPQACEFEKGSTLPCHIELSQDKDNKRHYNISLELKGDDDIENDDNEHAIPCACDAPRCCLIRTVMEKFAEEQDEVQTEAENTQTNAEIEAARVLDSETINDVSL